MPKSRVRKTEVFTPPPKRSASKRVSPPWVAPTMVGFMIVGVLWLVLGYVSNYGFPGMSANGRPGRQLDRGLRAAGDRTRPRHAVALDGSAPPLTDGLRRSHTSRKSLTVNSPQTGPGITRRNSSTTVIHTGDKSVTP